MGYTVAVVLQNTYVWEAATWKMLSIINGWENANQKHNEIPPHTRYNVCYKKDKKINVGKLVEKTDPLCTVGKVLRKC